MRRTPPADLTAPFYEKGWALHGRECWLAQFDPLERPCSERFEVIHLIGRQRIRNTLLPQLLFTILDGQPQVGAVRDLVELAEWDLRNCGGLGCEAHHRRFDNQLTPSLRVPAEALEQDALEFVDDWGFEIEAMRRFDNFDTAVLGAGVRNPQGRRRRKPAL